VGGGTVAVAVEVGARGVVVVVGRGVAVSLVGVDDIVGGNRVGVEGIAVAVDRTGEIGVRVTVCKVKTTPMITRTRMTPPRIIHTINGILFSSPR
jgi:hypothetical protein